MFFNLFFIEGILYIKLKLKFQIRAKKAPSKRNKKLF